MLKNMINKQVADKIAAQALNEIQAARIYKQGKIPHWHANEDMYYGKKIAPVESRSNVALSRTQEFVHTLMSKIDTPLIFKFIKRKESQLKRVEMLNALRQVDSLRDDWDIKDLAGKKQAIICGRAIYFYSASSDKGTYQSNLENCDVYDFLIDPLCGGLDIEKALNLGRYNILKTARELKAGVKEGLYYKTAVSNLLLSGGNVNDTAPEDTNKTSRSYGQNTIGQKQTIQPNVYKFWEWFTTYEGERYYLLMTDSGDVIRCEKLSDIFASNMYPVWTWAAFPDLTEFWTPSYCDYVREIFMAQDVSINQMLDNAEAINKPMKAVNVEAIADMATLKYRRDGYIYFKGDFDINKTIQTLAVPSINTPIQVFNILESIQQRVSGVTDGSKGMSDESGKVGIYEGNQAAAADRFNLLNKSYSFGYKRFAKLYEWGVREHLNKKMAVDMIGPNGVEVVEVTKRDIFRSKKDNEFGVLVQTSDAENMTSIQDQKAKLSFLSMQAINQQCNPKKVFEMQAKIVGFNEDEIKDLLDKTDYGNSELMSEAERDIERILDGETIKPNRIANNAYKQRVVDYINDHEEDISTEQFRALTQYVMSLTPIIMKNEARALNNFIINQTDNQTTANVPTSNTNGELTAEAGQPLQQPYEL